MHTDIDMRAPICICTIATRLEHQDAKEQDEIRPNGMSSFLGYLMRKLLHYCTKYIIIHSCRDKGFHAYPKGIFLKVDLIKQLEFELASYDSVVHVSHDSTETPKERKTI